MNAWPRVEYIRSRRRRVGERGKDKKISTVHFTAFSFPLQGNTDRCMVLASNSPSAATEDELLDGAFKEKYKYSSFD